MKRISVVKNVWISSYVWKYESQNLELKNFFKSFL